MALKQLGDENFIIYANPYKAAETIRLYKRVLLVIEDDESFAAILRDLSRELGFRALIAGTAEEALEMAKRYKPNAVVLDVGLPDESGLSVLDRLKRDEQTRHIPIHVVSASTKPKPPIPWERWDISSSRLSGKI